MPPIAYVQAILQRRSFTELIGATEDLWFEVKENHEFNLQGNQNHRIELSKDVSALANSEGDVLLPIHDELPNVGSCDGREFPIAEARRQVQPEPALEFIE